MCYSENASPELRLWKRVRVRVKVRVKVGVRVMV
jgi:hypothetical protein